MIGVDISDHSIKLVQLSNHRSPKYITHCDGIVPEGAIKRGVVVDPDTVRKTLHSVLTKCRLDGKIKDTFVFSIPETQTFLRVMEVPEMQDDEISEAIRWEVAQHIPLGLENMYIDWQPITTGAHSANQGKREIQVGAAQRKLVDALYEALKPFQFDVAAFELESQAIVRALISPEIRDKQGVVIVDVGGTATNVIIHDHGALRFTSTLSKGVDSAITELSEKERQGLQSGTTDLKDREGVVDRLRVVTEELANEVLSIAEFYNGIDAKHVVREIVLTGGGANIPGLDAAFLKYFNNIHVQRGNPWVNLFRGGGSVKPPLDVKSSIRYSTAIGLAMRNVTI